MRRAAPPLAAQLRARFKAPEWALFFEVADSTGFAGQHRGVIEMISLFVGQIGGIGILFGFFGFWEFVPFALSAVLLDTALLIAHYWFSQS